MAISIFLDHRLRVPCPFAAWPGSIEALSSPLSDPHKEEMKHERLTTKNAGSTHPCQELDGFKRNSKNSGRFQHLVSRFDKFRPNTNEIPDPHQRYNGLSNTGPLAKGMSENRRGGFTATTHGGATVLRRRVMADLVKAEAEHCLATHISALISGKGMASY